MKSIELETLAYLLFEIDARETMTVDELREHLNNLIEAGNPSVMRVAPLAKQINAADR